MIAVGPIHMLGFFIEYPIAQPLKIEIRAAIRATLIALPLHTVNRTNGDVLSVILALRLFVKRLSFFILTSDINLSYTKLIFDRSIKYDNLTGRPLRERQRCELHS